MTNGSPDVLHKQLLKAVIAENQAEVKRLLQIGANINCVDPSGSGYTPLKIAIDSLPMTRFLLENGADPNQYDGSGDPVWRLLSRHRRRAVSRISIKSGATNAHSSSETAGG